MHADHDLAVARPTGSQSSVFVAQEAAYLFPFPLLFFHPGKGMQVESHKHWSLPAFPAGRPVFIPDRRLGDHLGDALAGGFYGKEMRKRVHLACTPEALVGVLLLPNASDRRLSYHGEGATVGRPVGWRQARLGRI